MKKKGFTLIELLAVIIILAVIALIATPIVLNIIENARKGAAKSSAYGYIDGVKLFYADTILDGKDFILDGTFNVDAAGKLNGNNIELDGTKPSGGYLKYTNRKLKEGCLTISDYKVTISNGEVAKVEKGSCDGATSEKTFGGQVVLEEDKTYIGIAYLDPTDLSNTCTSSIAVSTTGTKTGCMKWYIFSQTDDTYTMILDHNTTAGIAWYVDDIGNNLYGPDEAFLNQLRTDANNWNGVVTLTEDDNYTPSKMYSGNPYTINYNGYKARLISAEEVAEISKQSNWTLGSSSFFFDTNCGTSGCSIGTNTYAWLFDNLGQNAGNCTLFGCNIGTNTDPHGYWTSSPYVGNRNYAFYVELAGRFTYTNTHGEALGIRPVIKVLKSNLS